MIRVAPLHYDRIFKKAFAVPLVFQGFVKDALGVTLNVDCVHAGYQYPKRAAKVDVAYDLFAEDEEQRLIVEMQHGKSSQFYDRYLYYHLLGLIEQVPSHAEYEFMRTVYTLVVLTDREAPPRTGFTTATMNMNPVTDEGRELKLYKHRLVFLVPQNVDESPPEDPALVRWLRLIRDSLAGELDEKLYQGPVFGRLIEQIRDENLTEEDREAMRQELADERAFVEKGEERARREIARNLLRQGLPVDQIAKATGLRANELVRLKAELESSPDKDD